jgi:hypothetical protein
VYSASGVTVMTNIEIRGTEEEEFDEQVQALSRRGYRIVDKKLVVDPAASPPVCGWILYRETTRAERLTLVPSGTVADNAPAS